MESSDLEPFLTKQWELRAKVFVQRMEPQDRRTIDSFLTYEEVREHVFVKQDEEASMAALQDLAMLQPKMVDLKNFSDFFTSHHSGSSASPFWGLLGLLLTLALRHEEAMRRVVRMLRKLSRNCHDFLLHCRTSPFITPEDRESCFDIFLRLTGFLADAVQSLRQAEDQLLQPTYTEYPQTSPWSPLTESFTAAADDIQDTLNRIEKVAAIYQRQYQSDIKFWFSYLALSSRMFQDTARLPCFVLPPMRSGRFRDRDDVNGKIERHFQIPNTTSSMRSLALYGNAGVGKSHVAQKYLAKKVATKDLDAIFWVNAESPLAILQSFTDAALQLKLPDTGPTTHDKNQTIFKGWLQQTKCRWMIVYDNAKTIELLRSHWPLPGSNGHILITTRNLQLAFNPADAGLEVSHWDLGTGISKRTTDTLLRQSTVSLPVQPPARDMDRMLREASLPRVYTA